MAYRVCLSPSNQTENRYPVGNTTEAEQCGRIAAACQTALERHGIEVICPHLDLMRDKIRLSDEFGADLHVPIHTNAFNGVVAGTRCFCSKFGTEGHKAVKAIFDLLAPLTPGTSENIKEYPTLFEMGCKAWTAYVEVSFHDNPAEAQWIIDNVVEIGETIAHGIVNYFGLSWIERDGTPQPEPDEIPEPTPEPGAKIRHRVIVEAGRVASFADVTKATNLLEQLTSLGVTAHIETVTL